jgi:hypothetical protein
MKGYGVRQLALFDTAGYSHALLDLSTPVHLAAPNNLGKSSLVNSLQFLYVDDIHRMSFAPHSVEETRRHYFKSERSYIVFECLTPSGYRCMLVRGLGDMQECEFERWVFEGTFSVEDFAQDDRTVAPFDVVRTRLAGRNLLQVKPSHLWETLCGVVVGKGGNSPTLNILPLQSRDEYLAFRDVYVKLLSLSDVNADALRRLIINCHAREIGEQRINVAVEYGEAFAAFEHHERELRFIDAASGRLADGRSVRDKLVRAKTEIGEAFPRLSAEVRQMGSLMDCDRKRAEAERQQILTRRHARLTERRASEQEQIKIAAVLLTEQQKERSLLSQHARFKGYSPDFVEAKRENAKAEMGRLAKLRDDVQNASGDDFELLRREVESCESRLNRNAVMLAGWSQSVAAVAVREGVTAEELSTAFRLLNPDILQLSVGASVEVADTSRAVSEIKRIARHIAGERFDSGFAVVDLRTVSGPDLRVLSNREATERESQLLDRDLKRKKQSLEVATNKDKAIQRLKAMEIAYEAVRIELTEYDQYRDGWERRDALSTTIRELETQVARVAEVRQTLDQADEDDQARLNKLGEQMVCLEGLRTALKDQWSELVSEIDAVGPDLITRPPFESAYSSLDLPSFESIDGNVRETQSHVRALTELVRMVQKQRQQLQDIEIQIKRVSAGLGQSVQFSDPDAEWDELLQKAEAIEQLRATVRNDWVSLSTTLRARLAGMAEGLESVNRAVKRLNAGLRSQRVSNLRAVEIRFERNEVASVIEELAGQESVFADPGREEMARQRLAKMIQCSEVLELRSMFYLRIRVQKNDGTWQEAASLEHVGSNGTGITAKAMIFVHLIRAVAQNEEYRLQFYLDETGQLDDPNLRAITGMAVERSVMPITAEIVVRVEPLAHPAVTVYLLGDDAKGRARIVKQNTIRATRIQQTETATIAG